MIRLCTPSTSACRCPHCSNASWAILPPTHLSQTLTKLGCLIPFKRTLLQRSGERGLVADLHMLRATCEIAPDAAQHSGVTRNLVCTACSAASLILHRRPVATPNISCGRCTRCLPSHRAGKHIVVWPDCLVHAHLRNALTVVLANAKSAGWEDKQADHSDDNSEDHRRDLRMDTK